MEQCTSQSDYSQNPGGPWQQSVKKFKPRLEAINLSRLGISKQPRRNSLVKVLPSSKAIALKISSPSRPKIEKQYACPHCDYKTKYSSYLPTHIRAHTGDKPYSCSLCEYKTTRSSNLVIHIRTHTKDKPFACPHCEYRTTTSSHMASHIRTHTGEKPISCPHCEYRTTRSSNLVRHIRIHTGDKPFSCPHCKYRATRSSHLTRHIRTHVDKFLLAPLMIIEEDLL